MNATCRTPGCENADLPVQVDEPVQLEGFPMPDLHVICGVCGLEIADIQEEA